MFVFVLFLRQLMDYTDMCKLQICINQGEDEKFMEAEIGSTDN